MKNTKTEAVNSSLLTPESSHDPSGDASRRIELKMNCKRKMINFENFDSSLILQLPQTSIAPTEKFQLMPRKSMYKSFGMELNRPDSRETNLK
jgi:hypothetical protein